MIDRPEAAPTRVVTAATPLARFGAIHRAAVRAEWAAAVAAGLDLRIREGDGLLFGAAPGLVSGMFNRAIGLAEQPGRLAEARAFFDANGVAGEVTLAPEDVPPAVEIALRLDAYLDAPDAIDPRPVEGLVIRPVGATSGETWMSVIVASYRPDPVVADLWRSMAPFVAANPRRRLLLGELDGRLVAASSIQATDDGAWLSWAGVLPEARGRGIQRAMIGARARLTAELGCDAIAAWALAGAHSSANLAASGLAPIGQRVSVRAADLG